MQRWQTAGPGGLQLSVLLGIYSLSSLDDSSLISSKLLKLLISTHTIKLITDNKILSDPFNESPDPELPNYTDKIEREMTKGENKRDSGEPH